MSNNTTKEIWDYINATDDENIQWDYIEDAETILRRLREWNILYFNQSEETPLASADWEAQLDPGQVLDDNMVEVIDKALDQDQTLHQDSRCILEEIKNNIQSSMPASQTTISIEEFRSFYRTTPEDRSSSPSGLHLGHYKAASHSLPFSEILHGIAETALTHEYALKRWQKSATILLEKCSGYPNIHRFRTVHLLESDLNFVMRKIWGKDFMEYNDSIQSFHNNQYGGRKGRQPTSAVLNKVLTLDIVRYFCEDMAIVDNDANACYDRVIPYLTMYMLRRLGMPLYLGQFMCNVLQKMEYTIKTDFGPTKAYSAADARIFGTGQGAGWSSPCWDTNSDVISSIFERYTPGMLLQHPNQFLESNRHGDVFVDDTSLGITQTAMDRFHPKPSDPVQKGHNLYVQTQLNTQFYSRLLFTTGGLLAIHKCLAYILIFQWIKGVRHIKPAETTYARIPIRQGIDLAEDFIKIKDPHEAFKMLGAYVAADGNVVV